MTEQMAYRDINTGSTINAPIQAIVSGMAYHRRRYAEGTRGFRTDQGDHAPESDDKCYSDRKVTSCYNDVTLSGTERAVSAVLKT